MIGLRSLKVSSVCISVLYDPVIFCHDQIPGAVIGSESFKPRSINHVSKPERCVKATCDVALSSTVYQ